MPLSLRCKFLKGMESGVDEFMGAEYESEGRIWLVFDDVAERPIATTAASPLGSLAKANGKTASVDNQVLQRRALDSVAYVGAFSDSLCCNSLSDFFPRVVFGTLTLLTSCLAFKRLIVSRQGICVTTPCR
jgi:hypothetical protein